MVARASFVSFPRSFAARRSASSTSPRASHPALVIVPSAIAALWSVVLADGEAPERPWRIPRRAPRDISRRRRSTIPSQLRVPGLSLARPQIRRRAPPVGREPSVEILNAIDDAAAEFGVDRTAAGQAEAFRRWTQTSRNSWQRRQSSELWSYSVTPAALPAFSVRVPAISG